eukprot:09898.XXX_526000_526104_1 [CDS] Oithona nana genome sequencing.
MDRKRSFFSNSYQTGIHPTIFTCFSLYSEFIHHV